jgi:RHS repeat-associated protein
MGCKKASVPLASAAWATASYIYADQIDTPRVFIRASDNKMVWRWDQADPFGLTPASENPQALGVLASNARFPGQVYDKESNLHYNWHRDFDPQLGRYIQSDPIGLAGGMNTFAYVEGMPTAYVDPDGLQKGGSGSSVRGALINRGGSMYRNTGDINGQIWQLNRDREGAVQSSEAMQRRANEMWGDAPIIPRDGGSVCRTVCPNAGSQCRPLTRPALSQGNGCFTQCDNLVIRNRL